MNNLDIIKAYHEALWADKNINSIDDVFAEDAMIHSPVSITQGTDNMKQVIATWLDAFPELTVHWDDYICDENKVVSRWHASGVQQQAFMRIEATGKEVNYQGVTIYEITNKKVTKYWALVDMQTIFKQLNA